jgi:hypothetical protein
MDISRVNDLLGQVRIKLESLDPTQADEGIETMSADSAGSVGVANGKLAHLMAKLTTGRSGTNRVRATGTSKRK